MFISQTMILPSSQECELTLLKWLQKKAPILMYEVHCYGIALQVRIYTFEIGSVIINLQFHKNALLLQNNTRISFENSGPVIALKNATNVLISCC